MKILTGTVTGLVNKIPPDLRGHLWRYALVGILSTAVYIGITALLVEIFALDPVVSSVGGFAVVTVMAYLLNHRWVFTSQRNHLAAFPSFIAATMVSLSLNAGIMHLVVHELDWWYGIGLIAVTGVVPTANFLMNYFWCFKANNTI